MRGRRTAAHAFAALLLGDLAFLAYSARVAGRTGVVVALLATAASVLAAGIWLVGTRRRWHVAAVVGAAAPAFMPAAEPVDVLGRMFIVVAAACWLAFVEFGDLHARVRRLGPDAGAVAPVMRVRLLRVLGTTSILGAAVTFGPTAIRVLLPPDVGRSVELASAWGVAYGAATTGAALLVLGAFLARRGPEGPSH